ncbi:MAG: glutamine-hydrolyzing GMP synthase, partial [Proteobacteria bacterium]|nr:glutamine-hydrolyzing GMP synthase [Pseudomonadota bacterium]
MTSPGAATGSDPYSERILILDFGSQYSQLIARRVREAGVYSELLPWDVPGKTVTEFGASGIILSGGPESVHGANAPKAPDEVFSLGIPVLGICYGMQTMADQLGGIVAPATHKEYGYAQVRARGHSSLLRDIEDHRTSEGYGLLDVWMSHGDRVEALPPEFRVIAQTDSAPLAGMADEERGFYGLQFHPEVT